MARFRTVDVHPYGVLVHQPWTSDVDTDAFARTARRVCEACSRGLAERDLLGKDSTVGRHVRPVVGRLLTRGVRPRRQDVALARRGPGGTDGVLGLAG